MHDEKIIYSGKDGNLVVTFDEDYRYQKNLTTLEVSKTPEWDYNIEDEFYLLENDYELVHMDISIHRAFWEYISLFYEDVEYIDGMQKYFDYCIENGITKEVLEKDYEGEVENIYEFKYNEDELILL